MIQLTGQGSALDIGDQVAGYISQIDREGDPATIKWRPLEHTICFLYFFHFFFGIGINSPMSQRCLI